MISSGSPRRARHSWAPSLSLCLASAIGAAILADACSGNSGSTAAESSGTSAAGSGGMPASTAGGSAGVGARASDSGIGGAPFDGDKGGEVGSGGAAGDGGPKDASTMPSCLTSGTELCDDFESGQLDAQKWKINKPTGSATVSIDGVQAHGGRYAVHIKVVAGQQSTAMIGESITFPTASNAFYSRMFVYFSPDIPVAANADYHTGFIIGSGKNDRGDVQAGMGMIGSAKQYLGYSIFFGDPKFEFGPWSKTLILANQWLCVELFEDGSNPTTEIRRVWLNGTELTDLSSNSGTAAAGQHPNHLPPKFDTVSFGLWEYHPIPTL